MDRVFFDTNVILDVLERRPPWFPESAESLALARKGRCLGAMTALSLSDIAYIQRSASTANLYERFRLLRSFLEIAPMDSASVDGALTDELADFEDGLQLRAALGWNATHFLTRNLKDFPVGSDLCILSPSEYLSQR
jgi:hypothetical protein